MKNRYEIEECLDGVWKNLDLGRRLRAAAIARARLVAEEANEYEPNRNATIRVIDTNTGGVCWQG